MRQRRGTSGGAGSALEILARTGYAAKGIVYGLLGILGVQAALGAGRAAGPEGAFTSIVQQPFGRILLAAVALGLAAYALWRFAQVAVDPDGEGSGAEAVVKRGAYAVSGAVYVALAVDEARLMAQPFGVWLVGLVGAALLVTGLYQLLEQQTYGPWLLGVVAFGLIVYALFAFVLARYRRIGGR